MMKPRVLRSGALLLLLAFVGCSSSSGPTGAARGAEPPSVPVAGFVAHSDEHLDVPTFVWVTRSGLPSFASASEAATATLRGLKGTLRLSEQALAAVDPPVIHDTGSGPVVARFTQRASGREIFRGQLSIVMNRAFEPIAASGLLAPSLAPLPAPFLSTATRGELDGKRALSIAHRAMTGRDTEALTALPPDDEYARFDAVGFDQPARVKEVLFPHRNGLEAAFRVEILLSGGGARAMVISADDGRVLFDHDLVRNDQYTYRVWASPETGLPMDGPQGNDFAPHPTGRPDRTRATFVPPRLVTLQNFPFSKNDPWLPSNATVTTGNNVDAYADLASPNGFTANARDLRADLTRPGAFDWTYDTERSPNVAPDSMKGAVTHLFYVLNFMHDWLYDAGFDEKSGNPQSANFSRGGKGNDRILAEAQDYSGRNNANAATPADGASPRIQMYVFGGRTTPTFTVVSPASIAGVKPTGVAGGVGKDIFDVTGPVVLALGGGADPNDACENLSNAAAVSGKLVLAHRGSCSFVQKAQKVQAAGGVGIIVANVPTSASPGTAPFMGGTAGDVTIPALSLSLADGQALEGALSAGATVNLRRQGQVDLDGALDTSIVTHEWGHVLSNRLVANGDGLSSNQAGGLGEGWSDFVALLVVARPDDLSSPLGANWGGAYPTGSYATSGSGDDSYYGIRRMPYSVDFTKNALTFKHISDGTPLPQNVPTSFGEDGSNNSEVHNTGEVWATMLWECYVALLRDPRLTFQEAQDRMKRYLIASLKLTPPDPTVLEARDAVLAAAYAGDEKDFALFWEAFARRGAGVGAEGPGKASVDNRGVKESFKTGNDLQIVSATLTDDVISCDHDGILDEGEEGTLEIVVRNVGVGSLAATTARVSSKASGLTLGEPAITFGPLKPFEVGKAKVRTQVKGSRPVDAIQIDVEVTDPTLAIPRTLRVAVPARRDADEADESSLVDTVETKGTSWTVTAKDRTRTSEKWHRVRVGDAQWWSVPNAGEPSDHLLTSAAFTVTGKSFGLSFRHRWAFESSAREKKEFDGGVVEVSLDGGKTWKDASEYGAVNYNVTLDNDPQGSNPIKGRKAFGNKSPGYPNTWVTTDIKLTLDAPADAVQIRFRAGADDNSAEAGWDVDDITLTDVATKPFWSFVPHREECDGLGPRVSAGVGQSVPARTTVTLQGTGTHPKDLPLNFFWTQVKGPAVQLTGDRGPTPSFVAPDVPSPTPLGFALRAHDGALLSPASLVDVTVTPNVAAVDSSGSAGGGGCSSTGGADLSTWGLGALALGLVRRRRGRAS